MYRTSEQAARRLFELMEDEDGRVALMEVSAVLDRGIGKPKDHSDEDNALSRLNLAAISPRAAPRDQPATPCHGPLVADATD